MKRDLHLEITTKIIAQIEAGKTPWNCPWDRSGMGSNPIRSTGQEYRGINTLILWAEQAAHGYTSNQWFTFKQAQALGGNVRKGSKGTTVVYYGKGESKTQTKKDGSPAEFVFLKAYTVFNYDQCENLPESYKPTPIAQRSQSWDNVADLEAFQIATGIKTNHGGTRAFFRPSTDSVTMPDRERFTNSHDYYATLFHEDVHATGESHRVGRPKLAKHFGDQAYAIEELVAELGAAFMCGHFGLASEPRPDHASYLASWLGVLKADPKALFIAASEAQKAADWLLKRAGIVGAEEAEEEKAAA
jgi:antirestriction protein ArdC